MNRTDRSDDDLARCRALLAQGSKTFSMAARLLPRDARDDVTALYAFCRVSDDLVDQPGDAARAVAALRSRLDRIYAGAPGDDPVDRALTVVVKRRGLPRPWLDALLEGYFWDARGRTYDTVDDLLDYAARVAGSVGACMALFMGIRERAVLARACELGVAMQLTNIARDIAEDARRGRRYLPSEWLAAEGIASSTEHDLVRDPELARVIERLLRQADALYTRADQGIANLPPRFRRSIRAARWLYAEIGEQLRRRRYDVSTRTVVPTLRKLWLVMRSLWSRSGEVESSTVPPLPAIVFLLDAAP